MATKANRYQNNPGGIPIPLSDYQTVPTRINGATLPMSPGYGGGGNRQITGFSSLPGTNYGETSDEAKAQTDAFMSKMQAQSGARHKLLTSMVGDPQWKTKVLASTLFKNSELQDIEPWMREMQRSRDQRANSLAPLPGQVQSQIPGAMSLVQNYNNSMGLPSTEGSWQAQANGNAAETANRLGVGAGNAGGQTSVAPWQPQMGLPGSDPGQQALWNAMKRPPVPYGGYAPGELMQHADNVLLQDTLNKNTPKVLPIHGLGGGDPKSPNNPSIGNGDGMSWQQYQDQMRSFMAGQAQNPGVWNGKTAQGDYLGDQRRYFETIAKLQEKQLPVLEKRAAKEQQARDMITAQRNGINPLLAAPYANLRRNQASDADMAAMFPALAPMYAEQARNAQETATNDQRNKIVLMTGLTNSLPGITDPAQRKMVMSMIANIGNQMNGASLPGTVANNTSSTPVANLGTIPTNEEGQITLPDGKSSYYAKPSDGEHYDFAPDNRQILKFPNGKLYVKSPDGTKMEEYTATLPPNGLLGVGPVDTKKSREKRKPIMEERRRTAPNWTPPFAGMKQ